MLPKCEPFRPFLTFGEKIFVTRNVTPPPSCEMLSSETHLLVLLKIMKVIVILSFELKLRSKNYCSLAVFQQLILMPVFIYSASTVNLEI